LAFGLIALAWHDYNDWHQPRYIVYAAAAQIFGGAAIQFRRYSRERSGNCAAAFAYSRDGETSHEKS
jgi:hypothetical protein